eukprot:6181082-Pleurochrysis_carterae.AAC.1
MIISYNTNNQGRGSERGRRGWARLWMWLLVGGAQPRSALRATYGDSRTLRAERERSAPHVRMRCECNLGDCVCDYRFTNERRKRRQFVSNCRARERVKMVIFGSRGQTLNNWPRSQYR